MKCKKCGVNNPINVNKCIYCGASLTSAERSTASRRNSQSQTRKSPSRKQKNRTDSVIIALIAVLLSVLIVMGSFYAFNSIPRRNGFHSGGGGGGIIDTNISFPGATHKVTFNLNYQTTEKNPEDQLVSNGDTVVMPLIAGRKGYAFGGWFEDSAYTNEFNFDTPVNKSYNLSAYWIDISDKTDTDGDGLPNPIEKYHKTDINKADTDGDGLSDYIEICNLNLDPLNKDTDNNMTSDGDEDYDGDGRCDNGCQQLIN